MGVNDDSEGEASLADRERRPLAVQPVPRFGGVAEDRERASGIDLAERFGHFLLEHRSDDDRDRADRSPPSKFEDLPGEGPELG